MWLETLLSNNDAVVKKTIVVKTPPTKAWIVIAPEIPGIKNPIIAEPKTIFAESVKKSTITFIIKY